jgi:hypothetical protein
MPYPVRGHFERQTNPLTSWVNDDAGFPNERCAEVWIDMVKDRSDLRNPRMVIVRLEEGVTAC